MSDDPAALLNCLSLTDFSVQSDVSSLDQRRREMSEFLNTMILRNPINLKEAMNRNIIFVGKTRSGKSTCLSVLKSPFTFVKLSSLFSETVEAQINHFTVEMGLGQGKDALNFNISIIDTPGLFEVRDFGTSRDNEALEEVVLKCMNAEITKINAIFFVVAYGSAGINPQDIDALERFLRLFDGAQKHVHVLITKSEKLSPEDKDNIEREFRKYPKMENLLSAINSKIYFMGAVEDSEFQNGLVDSFKLALPNVLNLRQILFLDIFKMTTYFELNALKMVDNVRGRAMKLYDELRKRFQEKDKIGPENLMNFKTGCKKLGTWLPLLDPAAYNVANGFLIECDKWLKEEEAKLPPVATQQQSEAV